MFNLDSSPSGNRIKLDKSDYPKVILGAILLFGMIILYVFEFKHFSLVLEPKWLLIFALGFGVMLGVALGNRFSKGEKESFERFRIYSIFIFISIFFMPLLINLSNRLLDFRKPEIHEVSLENVEAYISEKYGVLKGEDVKIAGYKIVVVMDGQVLQLKSKENPFPDNKPGDIVELTVHNGFFGLKYVKLSGD